MDTSGRARAHHCLICVFVMIGWVASSEEKLANRFETTQMTTLEGIRKPEQESLSATCFVQSLRISPPLRALRQCLRHQLRSRHPVQRSSTLSLRCSDKSEDEEAKSPKEKETLPDFVMRELSSSLQKRKKQVDAGAGRVYVVRTMRGFLNVHSDPSDPQRLDNVVTQIFEGDVVESVGPDRGDWVHHDLGGWSVRQYNNFTFLQPLDDAVEDSSKESST